ncbi:DsbA family oxidoreductase [Pedobacter antarcticus]|uniref:DsbA family oxidoreductase n=1 Tax=Pedobacter antarcticus TaxID=34086 RepID=UPI0029308E98|nr:DsbA family oxidoreductase [Pedobacter antarcticus]
MNIVKVDIISDYICPWCYIGKKRFQNAMDNFKGQYHFEINYIPFQLNPDMPVEGQNRREYRSKKFGSWEKSQKLDDGVVLVGNLEGLLFNYGFLEIIPNTLNAHLLTNYASKFNKHQELSNEIFKSYFTDGKDIGSDAVLTKIAASVGLDTESETFKNYKSDENKKIVEATEHLNKLSGVNSVPLFLIDNIAVSGAQSTQVFEKFILENIK